MLFVGIDWSDTALEYHLLNADQSELAKGQIPLTCTGMADLFETLDRHGRPDQIAIAIESTRGAWIQALLDRGYAVYPINPKRSEAFREALSVNGEKTDAIDARALALMLVAFHPRLRRLQQDDPQIVSLRIACQDRLRLVEERTAKSNELLSTLKTYYPAFLGLFGDHTSQIALEFLRQFPTQHQMKSLSPGKLRRWLKAHHYPKPDRVEAMIQQCKAPALPVPDHQQTSKAPLLQYLCTALETLNELIVQQDQTITRDFDPLPQSDWPKSLPGAGTALEPALLAVFGRDPNRFESVEEARALMGTGPVTKSSGKSRVILFRRGCWKFARRTLHLFADMTRTRCAWAKEFYQRQRAAGKKHHMALRALAHKWTKIIWALVRTGQPYKEAIFVQSQSRYRREAINRTK